MMAATSTNDATVVAALKAFLLANVVDTNILTADEVVGDAGNRVPMPKGGYIVMNHLGKPRMSTNHKDLSGPSIVITQPTDYGVQLDCSGPNGGDWAAAISALWFDSVAADFFVAYGLAPLYTTEPKDSPWTNGEGQWESRWTIDVHLQVNPSYVITTGSFTSAEVSTSIVDVDDGGASIEEG